MSLQEGIFDTSEQNLSGLIRGGISYSPESGGFWGKVASGLGSVMRNASKAIPSIAEAFSAANSPSATSGSYGMSGGPDNLPIYESYSSTRNHTVKPLAKRTVPSATYRPLTQDALGQIQESQRPQKMNMNQLAANSTRILNNLAKSQGLPSYEQFHQEHGLVYQGNAKNDSSGIEQYFKSQVSRQPKKMSRNEIPSIQDAQKPVSYSELAYTPDLPSIEDALASLPMSKAKLPKAEYKDRAEGKVNLWQKLQNGQVLSDSEMKQLFHTLELQQYQSQHAKEKTQAEWTRLYAEQKLAENLVANAKHDTDGNVLIGGVSVRSEDALFFAKQDIQHFRDTDTHLSPDQLEALRTMPGRYKRTGQFQEPRLRISITERLRATRTTAGSFKTIVRALAQVEKGLAQQYPNNPQLWKGRLANQAAHIKPGLRYNSNDIPLTHAGHALEKHGNRNLPTSIFPKPRGTNTSKNQLGQDIVEEILFDDATISTKRLPTAKEKGRDPSVQYFIEVKADYGQGPGLLFKNGSVLHGFLEP